MIPIFDQVVFITLENKTRLKRLEKREFIRNGIDILPLGSKHKDNLDFMEWADKY